jgi:tRNA-splicing ligase RtcB (3'-phosphate/5'-hydroxy nucleic acid ligase)
MDMALRYNGPLQRIDEYRWRIPKSYMQGMRVDGIVYASDKLIKGIENDNALQQVANVAMLPGIVKCSLAMPDIHWGYGFSIGGVAATDIEEQGVISPGGVGFDINCGVRLLKTDLFEKDIRPKLKDIVCGLYKDVPSGVGSKGAIKVTAKEEEKILLKGAGWALSQGYATESDIECTEEKGAMKEANPDAVSERAYERGRQQSGTLGSGNHFIEVQEVDEIYDERAASIFDLSKGQVVIMIHSGSRGLGYQICEDYSRKMVHVLSKYNITVPDRQLACAPFNSEEAQMYFGAMKCAANYAWNNRQCIMHLVRLVFEKIFQQSFNSLGMTLIYDVAHNIAKLERHKIDGKEKALCVHRKGATRAFGPGSPDLPNAYRDIGQPVIIPGDMGTHSYLMLGTQIAVDETFATTCHGAGRALSRKAASQNYTASQITQQLKEKGIEIMASGKATIAEEAPDAYKNIDDVISAVNGAGISKKVCRMRPLGVIKG